MEKTWSSMASSMPTSIQAWDSCSQRGQRCSNTAIATSRTITTLASAFTSVETISPSRNSEASSSSRVHSAPSGLSHLYLHVCVAGLQCAHTSGASSRHSGRRSSSSSKRSEDSVASTMLSGEQRKPSGWARLWQVQLPSSSVALAL